VDAGGSLATKAGIAKTVHEKITPDGAKHLAHCACANASYLIDKGLANGKPASGNDLYFVSLLRGGEKWAAFHGDAGHQFKLFSDALVAVGMIHRDRLSGYIPSKSLNTAHGICDGHVFYRSGRGGEPLSAASIYARNEEFENCLFDLEKGALSSNVLDTFAFSVWTNSGKSLVRVGPSSKETTLTQEALDALGTRPDGQRSSVYSSSRLTLTNLRCRLPENNGADYGGAGSLSLERAQKAANANQWKSCTYSTYDVAF
jgi:hypothetical protein